jgi:hypothetical protein
MQNADNKTLAALFRRVGVGFIPILAAAGYRYKNLFN